MQELNDERVLFAFARDLEPALTVASGETVRIRTQDCFGNQVQTPEDEDVYKRQHLGAGVEPFGAVASSTGHGNNDADKQDGVRYKNVVGTYLHGPLLAKNPEVADDLLARALQRFTSRTDVYKRQGSV